MIESAVVDLETAELLARLGTAAGLAAALGLERELRQHPAGVRTHALVGVGACLFTIAGAYGFADIDAQPQDPARIAAQVATGIGFVGGGAILRNGASVRGLTTASTLWLAAAVGVTAGAGRYDAALIGGVIVLVLLVGLRFAKRWLPDGSTVVTAEYDTGHGTLGPLLRELERWATVRHLSIDDEAPSTSSSDGVRTVTVDLVVVDPAAMAPSLERLRNRPEVRWLACGGSPAPVPPGTDRSPL